MIKIFIFILLNLFAVQKNFFASKTNCPFTNTTRHKILQVTTTSPINIFPQSNKKEDQTNDLTKNTTPNKTTCTQSDIKKTQEEIDVLVKLAKTKENNVIDVIILDILSTFNANVTKDTFPICKSLLNWQDVVEPTNDRTSSFLESMQKMGINLAYGFVNSEKELIEYLRGGDNVKIKLSLSIIKKLFFNKYKYENIITTTNNKITDNTKQNVYNRFSTRFFQPFYHSRSLLAIALSPEIIKIYFGTNVATNNQRSTRYSDSPVEFTYSFSANDINYDLKMSKKIHGAQFGAVMTIFQEKNEKRKYHVKAYFGYPGNNAANSASALAYSSSYKLSSEISEIKQAPYQLPDLKEMFIYKTFELMDIGPKVHFLLNRYIRNGLFIATEDLSNINENFICMGDLSNNPDWDSFNRDVIAELSKIMSNYAHIDFKIYKTIVNLLEVDTIFRIFKISDANEGNIGFLHPKTNNIINSNISIGEDWIKSGNKEFKIIDFLAPNAETNNDSVYVADEIFNHFLTGNSITKYRIWGIMDLATNRNNQTLPKFNVKQEKLYFGKQVMEKIEKRFHSDISTILSRSKSEIFKVLKNTCNDIPWWEIIGFSKEQIECASLDLDLYIKAVKDNYNTLKDAIEKGV